MLGVVICLVISIASGAYTCFFLSQSRAATATVIRLVEYKNNDNESVLSPVYEYDVDGVRYEDRPTGSDGRHFSVGDQVPIRYHQNRPHESRIDYWGHRWGVPVFMLCAAIVLAAWAVVLRIGNHRREGQ
ncbi:MAG: DUF3592 domain-containing protein [Planctomycetes bacterium]|nr:DUF3592 domain-containing protein [Planctomycetota bacterium]